MWNKTFNFWRISPDTVYFCADTISRPPLLFNLFRYLYYCFWRRWCHFTRSVWIDFHVNKGGEVTGRIYTSTNKRWIILLKEVWNTHLARTVLRQLLKQWKLTQWTQGVSNERLGIALLVAAGHSQTTGHAVATKCSWYIFSPVHYQGHDSPIEHPSATFLSKINFFGSLEAQYSNIYTYFTDHRSSRSQSKQWRHFGCNEISNLTYTQLMQHIE